jgi:hypothetical protein
MLAFAARDPMHGNLSYGMQPSTSKGVPVSHRPRPQPQDLGTAPAGSRLRGRSYDADAIVAARQRPADRDVQLDMTPLGMVSEPAPKCCTHVCTACVSIALLAKPSASALVSDTSSSERLWHFLCFAWKEDPTKTMTSKALPMGMHPTGFRAWL